MDGVAHEGYTQVVLPIQTSLHNREQTIHNQ